MGNSGPYAGMWPEPSNAGLTKGGFSERLHGDSGKGKGGGRPHKTRMAKENPACTLTQTAVVKEGNVERNLLHMLPAPGGEKTKVFKGFWQRKRPVPEEEIPVRPDGGKRRKRGRKKV